MPQPFPIIMSTPFPIASLAHVTSYLQYIDVILELHDDAEDSPEAHDNLPLWVTRSCDLITSSMRRARLQCSTPRLVRHGYHEAVFRVSLQHVSLFICQTTASVCLDWCGVLRDLLDSTEHLQLHLARIPQAALRQGAPCKLFYFDDEEGVETTISVLRPFTLGTCLVPAYFPWSVSGPDPALHPVIIQHVREALLNREYEAEDKFRTVDLLIVYIRAHFTSFIADLPTASPCTRLLSNPPTWETMMTRCCIHLHDLQVAATYRRNHINSLDPSWTFTLRHHRLYDKFFPITFLDAFPGYELYGFYNFIACGLLPPPTTAAFRIYFSTQTYSVTLYDITYSPASFTSKYPTSTPDGILVPPSTRSPTGKSAAGRNTINFAPAHKRSSNLPCASGTRPALIATYHPHLNAPFVYTFLRKLGVQLEVPMIVTFLEGGNGARLLRAHHRYTHYRDLPELLGTRSLIEQRETLATIIQYVGSNGILKFFSQRVLRRNSTPIAYLYLLVRFLVFVDEGTFRLVTDCFLFLSWLMTFYDKLNIGWTAIYFITENGFRLTIYRDIPLLKERFLSHTNGDYMDTLYGCDLTADSYVNSRTYGKTLNTL
ncbi:unnamed protein product [Symbiodinium sp. CCMP2592]|nr:unnamed protein product [Symbiodinium sp. CCMP2592]